MASFDKALTVLEYHKILEMLAGCAATEGAKAAIRSLRPSDDPLHIRRRQQQTTDAKRMISLKGAPPFGGIRDILPALGRAEKGAPLSMRELLDIAGVWHAARMLKNYCLADKTFDTVLDDYFGRLFADRAAEDRLTRAILSEDQMADEASPALAEIRRHIRRTSDKIKETLQQYISGGTFSKYLQENIVTTRGGRFVVPVKLEHKNEVRGLVHDTSASGATVFIEPMAVVEANNELRELESREEREIDRILAELSALCAAHSGELALNYQNITELAIIFARAELSFRMNAAQPQIADHPVLDLYRARHPLLDPKRAVPVRLMLGTDFDTLIITGPNTGGKTVTLKTAGLLTLMAQSGLHIPADEQSTVGVFTDVLADIGDEQSIEQSLSTFSAHMVNIVRILSVCGSGSLVLFDELGAGTDPVEGAALATAILEEVRGRGALCAATTHYAELKAYAIDTEGVCNAACEFDLETLRPTYRLLIGTPGKSNAFAISARLGLDASVIARAEESISGENRRFESVVGQLEKTRADLEHAQTEAEALRAEWQRKVGDAERTLEEKTKQTEAELEKQRARAVQILESARATSEYVMDQLEKVKRKQNTAELGQSLEEAKRNIRKRLRETDDAINPVQAAKRPENYKPSRPYRRGDEVLLTGMNQTGVLLEDPEKNGNVQVQVGILKMRMNVRDLQLREDQPAAAVPSAKKKKSDTYQQTVHKTFSPEIDLRGQLSDDAWFMTDRYLDDAQMAGVHSVTLIHGKGTGALRAALWKQLKTDPRVASFRQGQYGEGDAGVTVVELKK